MSSQASIQRDRDPAPAPIRQALAGQPMILVCLASCVGICADRLSTNPFVSPRVWWILSTAVLAAWLFAFLRRSPRSAWLLLIAVGCGMAGWHHYQWRMFSHRDVSLSVIGRDEAKAVAFRCRVTSVPESSPLPKESPAGSLATIPRGIRTRFRVQVLQSRHLTAWVKTSGNLPVRVNGHLLGLHVGDKVQIFGSLSPLPAPVNPGQYDQRVAMRTERTIGRIDVSHPDCVTRFPETGSASLYSQFLTSIGQMRTAGLALLDEFIGSPRDVLAGALLLGARDRLESERTEFFFHTGTIHLLAISGLHLGILAWGFFVFAKHSAFRRWAITALMAFSLIYCFLTGMREPVLRAAILVQVACAGIIWHRTILAYNALAAAAVVVLLMRPAALFRPGAQLSFLAVGALIWLSLNYRTVESSALEKFVQRSRPWYLRLTMKVFEKASQLAFIGLIVWLVTLPLVMLKFHLLSPIALVLNVVLAAPIAISLLSGFSVLVTGRLFHGLAATCGLICDRGLAFVETAVQYAHEIPGAYCWVAGPYPMWCGAFYLGLALLALVPGLRPTRRGAVTWLVVWLTLPVAADLISLGLSYGGLRPEQSRKNELSCTFLSVGHGTCVVLELPDDRVMLYDCGRMGMPEPGVRLVSEFLWHRRISYIDGVVLSHADADHYNILPGLLERFPVGRVFASPVMFTSPSPGVQVVHDAIESRRIPIQSLQTDDCMTFGGTKMRVLHPLAPGVRGSDNANSIVLEIEHQGRTMLLPGDLESPGLEDVMAEMPRDCDVLMAPHHGSTNSSPVEFTNWCSPEWLVISGRHDPDREAQQQLVFSKLGCHVLHTAEVGAVTVRIHESELSVEPFRIP